MARLNTRAPRAPRTRTHNGASVVAAGNEEKLRRTILGCLLWEDNFYEDGESVAERIKALVPTVDPQVVSDLAVEARTAFNLRHAPLYLTREAARNPSHRHIVADTLAEVIQRPDELAEFLTMYWTEKKGNYRENPSGYTRYQQEYESPITSVFKKTPIAASVKKGLARAFTKFDEYQLAKYNRDNAIKLRDVLFLCHAKPQDAKQASLWNRLAEGTLATPDTWEVKQSAGVDKKVDFTRRLHQNIDPKQKNTLGALALLRNLRGMEQAGVDRSLIKDGLRAMNAERVLPYRFITAAKYAPWAEDALEHGMLKCLGTQEKIKGKTVLLVDVSYSMNDQLSQKSDMTRLDAAAGIAILAREVCEDVEIFTFDNDIRTVAPRRGFALRDAIGRPRGGTSLGKAMQHVNRRCDYDRVLVFTDEQSSDAVPDPTGKGYIINIAAYANGVGYKSKWTHVNGFSEATIDYIREYERQLSK